MAQAAGQGTPADAEKAYRRMLKVLHPDKMVTAPLAMQVQALAQSMAEDYGRCGLPWYSISSTKRASEQNKPAAAVINYPLIESINLYKLNSFYISISISISIILQENMVPLT